MVTLAADLTALAGLATTNTGLTASNGDKFKLEDEVVEFARYQPGIRPDSSWEYATPADPTKIILRRGRDRTVAVPHAAGTTLVPASDAYGAGGGGVSVTDGTTTVVATSLQMPAGTVTDLGGGVAGVGLIWASISADVAFDTPDLNNPVIFGPAVLTIPAGSFFQAFALLTQPWNANGDLDIGIADDDQGTNFAIVAAYLPQTASVANPTSGSIREPNHDSYNIDANVVPKEDGQPRWGFTLTEQVICVGFYPSAGDPTAGSAKIVVVLASPAV